MRSSRNSIKRGGSNIEGELLLCQLHFQCTRKTKKKSSAQGSLKFREVSNGFCKGTRREIKICTFNVVLCFLQVFSMYIIGKKGCRFQLCHRFLAVFLLGQDMVMSQMSLYIELEFHS